MEINYEIKNQKLKKMVEKKANQLKIPVDQLILNYINRGLRVMVAMKILSRNCILLSF